jgi:periplasmic protein TonB
MDSATTPGLTTRATTLLAWCVTGSIAVHVLAVMVLPGLRADKETPPTPLVVELLKPPEIAPPKPLPVQARPLPANTPERPKAKPEPVKPAPREERPVAQPRQILTAPAEVAPSPAAPVVPVTPEQKPAPPEPPRAPPAPSTPVTQPFFNAAYLNNPKPEYPQIAFRRGESGTVFVLVLVTKEGRAARVSVHKSSGSSALDTAATRAISGWRFEPARKGTEAVEAEVIVPLDFNLKDAR